MFSGLAFGWQSQGRLAASVLSGARRLWLSLHCLCRPPSVLRTFRYSKCAVALLRETKGLVALRQIEAPNVRVGMAAIRVRV